MKNLDILYEDNHLIVVVKPYNMPVQADNSLDLDLLTVVKRYLKEKYQKPGNVYLGLVHRLDRPVGGIMVFAKTSKAASRLSEMIRTHNFTKNYLAIVHGNPEAKAKLHDKISKDNQTHSAYIDEANGKDSILEYEKISYHAASDLSLIKVKLETGRHHQIRLQMAHHGHALYGDQRYGKKEKDQIALFAYELSFMHPVAKEHLAFKKLPPLTSKWKLFTNDLEKLN